MLDLELTFPDIYFFTKLSLWFGFGMIFSNFHRVL